jgi:hypothetical protein
LIVLIKLLMSAINSAWSVVSTDACDDGIVFRLNVIGIHVELCLASTFMRRFTCSIRDDIERVPVPTGLTPLTFPVPIFSSTTIFKLHYFCSASLSDGVNDPI